MKNARKGHLLLTPGGPSGLIGALLSALTPAQDYSHMGIIVEDDGINGTVLRHCTTSEDWLNSGPFQTGKVFASTPLEKKIPEHGFRSDAVKFLWPGTVTQTVEVAFKASKADSVYRKDVYEVDGDGEPLTVDDENGDPQNVLKERFATIDAPNSAGDSRATGKSFLIHALSFDPQFVGKTDKIPEHVANALIVQPCVLRETTQVRDALKRVADATLELRGHYRFFSYTDCRIGDVEDGPPTLETSSQPFCRDGKLVTDPVLATRGMVCSTFIWEAVQLANRRGGPRIVLDGRPSRTEPAQDVCLDLFEQMNGRKRIAPSPQNPADRQDGLYFYDPSSRHAAAMALQERLIAKVMDNVGSFMDTVAGKPVDGLVQGGLAGVVISDLIGTNPLLLAILLGVTKAYVDTQIQILRDTARHLSNQIGSTFQSDNSAEDNDSDQWQLSPGIGNTVSPDDIVNCWAAPYFESNDEIVGIYGFSQRVEVLSPAPVDGPTKLSTWEISPISPFDPPHLQVRVFRRDGAGKQIFLAHARVQVGCFETLTAILPDMTQAQSVSEVRVGQYYARAGWQDPAVGGLQWKGPRQIVTIPGPVVDLEVFPPKETRRSVRISGKADLLNRHATDEIPVIGTDPWERNNVPFNSNWIPMGLDMAKIDPGDDPEFSTWLKDNYANELGSRAQKTYFWSEKIETWGIARAEFVCEMSSTGDIHITVTGGTKKNGDDEDFQFGDPQPVVTVLRKANNSDGPHRFELRIERVGPGFPPVRATLHIEVDNNQQGG